jgi:alpha-maltose-1-phosphate synthase
MPDPSNHKTPAPSAEVTLQRGGTPGRTKLETILLLTFDYGGKIGGIGTHVQDVAHGLNDAGYKVIVLAHASGASSVVHERAVQIHYVGASLRTLSQSAQLSIGQNMLAYNQDLIEYARMLPIQPDIVHYHHWFPLAAARQLGARLDVPIVGSVHYLTEPVERWWGQIPNSSVAEQETLWLQNEPNLIAVSNSMREVVEQYYPATRGRIDTVTNSVNVDVFQKTPLGPEARRQLKKTIAKNGEHIALFAGRINPQKGLDALVDSAARVVERHPEIRYLIAGAPDSRDYLSILQERIRSFPGLERHFTFVGKVARQKLSLLYQAADIAVFPSVYEPFGLVAVEAMISGIPTIVTRAGGLAEIVTHERTGLHVSVHVDEESGLRRVDVPELAAAQLRLLEDAALRQRLGQAGHDHIVNDLTFERTTLQPLVEVYRKTLRAHRGVRAEVSA